MSNVNKAITQSTKKFDRLTDASASAVGVVRNMINALQSINNDIKDEILDVDIMTCRYKELSFDLQEKKKENDTIINNFMKLLES